MKPGASNRVPDAEYVTEILPEHLPDDLLSIAVFGPGTGEAIVVRLPDGTIGIVDGCREPQKKDPRGRGDPIRELLTKFENKASASLRIGFVCLTHAHADHYRGLGKLINAYQGRIDHLWTVSHAIPKYENALREWLELIRAGITPDEEDILGLTLVLEQLHQERLRVESSNPTGYAQLSAQKHLLKRSVNGRDVIIEACGPADGDLEDAHNQLANILDAASKGDKVSRSHDPNLTSGALLLRWGYAGVLLGGDLLSGKKESSGWQRAAHQIDCAVQVVNVAHHASEEAHDAALWAKISPALAIVTPFMHGQAPYPPRPDQIVELAKSSVVAITSPPVWDGEVNPPKAMSGAKSTARLPTPSPLLSSPSTKDPGARRNAVSVSLDATGTIRRFVLAGRADVYDG